MDTDRLIFPENFVWGTATSSYQIEGAVHEDGRGESIWDRCAHTPGFVEDNTNGDTACDHYHRFPEDIRIMSDLGIKAYRFSTAWPRILPKGWGAVNSRGLEFYDRLVDELLGHGITPWLTLYHWDLPQALEVKGGWRVKQTAQAFEEYTHVVVSRLSDRVTHWMTLNEPPCSAYEGYRDGRHAPGVRAPRKIVNQVIHNLLLAHGLGMGIIRAEADAPPSAGLAFNPFVMVPEKEHPDHVEAARRAWFNSNAWWFEPLFKGKYPEDQWEAMGSDVPDISPQEMAAISSPMDFVGINTYFAGTVRADVSPGSPGYKILPWPGPPPHTQMGWPIVPDCMYYSFKFMHEQYNLPAYYITENGAAFPDTLREDGSIRDKDRISYLDTHLRSLHRAVSEGIPVNGYFLWSLMDNFEWARGFAKRFGIVYVDISSQKRLLKDSARWYRQVIENNGIEGEARH